MRSLTAKPERTGRLLGAPNLFLLPARPGSFVFDVAVWMVEACAAGLVYDFVAQDDADLQNGLLKRIEPTMGELPAMLENSLRKAHRPIQERPEMTDD
jgi:hypothetical protein